MIKHIQDTVALHNGVNMPGLGLGVYEPPLDTLRLEVGVSYQPCRYPLQANRLAIFFRFTRRSNDTVQ